MATYQFSALADGQAISGSITTAQLAATKAGKPMSDAQRIKIH